jgi:mono/diheme cytochrome c family protein
MKLQRILLALLSCLILTGTTFAQDGADLEAGKKVYEQVCKTCHSLSDKRGTGPGFYGAHAAWGDNIDEMVYMIRSGAQKYIKEGRTYADRMTQLFGEYGTYMPPQNVTEAEARNVLAYVKAEAKPAAAATAAAPGAGGAAAGPMAGVSGESIYFGLAVLVAVLALAVVALIAIIAVIVTATRRKMAVEEGEAESFSLASGSKITFATLLKNPFVLTVAGLFITMMVFSYLITSGRSVGLHQGYQPVQPIAFSHALHAGQYEIACQYCHVGAEKGKSATIPSSNVCANCHHKRGGIQEGAKYGTAEIAKVLASNADNKPIEWVRIHNLPDLVYFNHAQHTVVGGLECQECHGQIQEMEEVWQVNNLSMGWCINCHREKEVDVTKSDYYKYHHGAYIGSEEKVTVAKLGGLDCARCHY